MHQSTQYAEGGNGHIRLENLHNTRDLGGIVTQEGRRIEPKKLLRSGMLADTSDNDIKVLTEEYAVCSVIDLRTEDERKNRPDPVEKFNRVTFHDISILDHEAVGVTCGRTGYFTKELEELARDPVEVMAGLYSEMVLDPDSQKGFASFFDVILDLDEGSVLWHCTLGKDRVGMATYLLLNALGVPEEIVVADYLATNRFIRSPLQDILNESVGSPLSSRMKEGLRVIESADVRFLQAAVDSIGAEYGDMETYLYEAIDVDKDKTKALKGKYLQ